MTCVLLVLSLLRSPGAAAAWLISERPRKSSSSEMTSRALCRRPHGRPLFALQQHWGESNQSSYYSNLLQAAFSSVGELHVDRTRHFAFLHASAQTSSSGSLYSSSGNPATITGAQVREGGCVYAQLAIRVSANPSPQHADPATCKGFLMADKDVEARNTPSPGPGRRQRAPTITIDTSAVNPNDTTTMGDSVPLGDLQDNRSSSSQHQNEGNGDVSPSTSKHPTSELRAANSFESRESRPTSPHNVSSPTNWGTSSQGFLNVPGRSRGNSFDTENGESTTSGTYIASSQGETVRGDHLTNDVLLNDKDALRPDPGTESEFEVENNPFAFSPGQLGKLYNPKSLAAFHALGGLDGLEKGLKTDRKSGLSVDEQRVDGTISFEEATTPGASHAPKSAPTNKVLRTDTAGEPTNSEGFVDRKRVFSDNRLPVRKPKNILQLAWIAYNDKVLILLTIAAVISLALGLYETFGVKHEPGVPKVEWVEGVAIIVAIVIVVVVGAANDWQKERQFVKLNKKKDDRYIKVVRSGKLREISVYDILVGDLVNLEPGDMVPVDGILVQGHGVKCDESSATGESDLLKKTAADDVFRSIENHEPLKKMDPFILSGAKVSEGVGTFLVTATGIHSSYGKTMMSLREDAEVTPLQSKLNTLATYIAKLGGASALLLFVVLFIEFLVRLRGSSDTPAEKGQHFLDILIVAITVVVVAVPEGLPLAVTLALAFATTRMLKDNNLVRLLRSCETMGNATTICSDKTGTLTQNKMTVVSGTLGTAVRFGDRKLKAPASSEPIDDGAKGKHSLETPVENTDDVSPSEFVSNLSKEVKELLEQSIVQNTTAFEGPEGGPDPFIGSKTETALLGFARDHLGMGPLSTERSNASIVQVVPFDSAIKCSGAVAKLADDRYRVYVKGASEILLAKCEYIVSDATKELMQTPLTEDNRETLEQVINTYASRSLRTIGLVYRDFESWPPRDARKNEDDANQAVFEDVFKSMTFLAIVGIQDPLRDGVREAVKDCQSAGVYVRMVTGDNVLTAKAIAEDCGILVPGGLVMEGPTFRKLSKRDMDAAIPKLCVLARSSPEDKRKLVKRLKELGETVAVTGDGTNDAPALKTADVGFSMGIAGTEVAKEASAIILMDDNFASIVKALLWGRAVNDAVKKFLQFQITVNITAVLLTFISAVSSEDQTSVLTAVQLLWVNLIMDTFAALALATDPPTRSLLNRKPDPKSAPLITLNMWKMIIGQAIYQLVVTLILYFAGEKILSYDSPEEKERMPTLVFNTFVWMQIFNSLNNRRLDNRFNVFEGITHNWFFIGILGIMIGGQTMIVFIGGRAFSVTRINGPQWAYSIVLGALSLVVGVIVRLIPDELVARCIPSFFKRKRTPEIAVSDDYQWNQGLLEIRDELAFIKKVRGGRLSNLKFKIEHPREIFSRSRSSQSLPATPNNGSTIDHEGSPAPPTPDSRSRRRNRSRSNSAFGPAAVMAGIVAGSVAGWSPIDRPCGENDSLKFSRNRSKSDLEAQEGIEVHPDTKSTDPILAPDPSQYRGPPSQNPDTTPNFNVGPFAGDPKSNDNKSKPPS
ncbi:calcium transporting P-type ATPase-like protein [Bimuria novae-zelandiae CBS 107.79]|uniref:Calcium-transporting ATPase n=1 Tax=Bimuria novae-zelandiae CBS 107.79 TaxID=1447943 RepID=A0A6A5UGI7_9PLEO|nr:calcium transporting P-type ATPase-like protein [Bimuria novae-zelandiae CBS 107.79]